MENPWDKLENNKNYGNGYRNKMNNFEKPDIQNYESTSPQKIIYT
jgi:hypothetical protein